MRAADVALVSTGRSLFVGSDYRPSSRPGSSYGGFSDDVFGAHAELGAALSRSGSRAGSRGRMGSAGGSSTGGGVGRPPMVSRFAEPGEFGPAMGAPSSPSRFAGSGGGPVVGIAFDGVDSGRWDDLDGGVGGGGGREPTPPEGAATHGASPKKVRVRNPAAAAAEDADGSGDSPSGTTPSPWATGEEDHGGPASPSWAERDDGLVHGSAGEHGEGPASTDSGDSGHGATVEAAVVAAHALLECTARVGDLQRALVDSAARMREATKAAEAEGGKHEEGGDVSVHQRRVCAACDAIWPQVDKLCASLANVFGDRELLLAPVIAKPYADGLTARRRLLRATIKAMDNASGAPLLRLARVALCLASTPGPLTFSEKEPQAAVAAATSGGVASSRQKALLGAALHTARLLFAASKKQDLDAEFRSSGLLQQLLRLLPRPPSPQEGDSKEAALPSAASGEDLVGGSAMDVESWRPVDELVYITGVLKNVSNSSENQQWLVQQGAVAVLVGVLRGAQAAAARPGSGGSGSGSDPEAAHLGAGSASGSSPSQRQLAQLMVQATGALRNLCLVKRHLKPFWDSDAVDVLLTVLKSYSRHSELMLNVARILSKLSLNDRCRSRFTKNPRHLRALLRLVSVHPSHATLLVRVCFVLGNLSASNDTNRVRIAVEFGGVPSLLRTMAYFGKRYLRDHSARPGSSESKDGDEDVAEAAAKPKRSNVGGPKDTHDVLVKIIRVLANLAINPDVGTRMAATPGIEMMVTLLEAVEVEEHEELALNLVSAVTNLSFYAARRRSDGAAATIEALPGPDGPTEGATGVDLIAERRHSLVPVLAPLLLHPNEEAVIEAARAFGNFSRDAEVRRAMVTVRAVDALVILLDHANRELVFTAVGALMNAVLDPTAKLVLRDADGGSGVDHLDGLIRSAWLEEPEIASVACKSVFNLLMGADEPMLSAEQCTALLETLGGLEDDAEDAADEEEAAEGKADDGGDRQSRVAAMRELGAVAAKVRASVKSVVQSGAVLDEEDGTTAERTTDLEELEAP